MREPITWHRLTSCNHVDYRSPLLEQRSSHQSIFLFYHCHYYINIIRKCSVQIHIYIYIYLYFFFFVFLCSITPFSSKCTVSAAIKHVCFQSSRVDDWDKRAFFGRGGGRKQKNKIKNRFALLWAAFMNRASIRCISFNIDQQDEAFMRHYSRLIAENH